MITKDPSIPVAHAHVPAKRLDFFERYLTVWVFGCMVLGLALGKFLPDWTRRIGELEFGKDSHVNIPIAVLIWLMIYPMMLKIGFGGIRGVFVKPKGLFVTLFVNWLVKPFSMALLGWLFITHLFGGVLGWIEPDTAKNYVAGLIILAAAPCTAMVFVWSYLTEATVRTRLPRSPSTTSSWSSRLLPSSCCWSASPASTSPAPCSSRSAG